MDPNLTQALATLISAVATVLLMAGTFYFKGRRPHDDEEEIEDDDAA